MYAYMYATDQKFGVCEIFLDINTLNLNLFNKDALN